MFAFQTPPRMMLGWALCGLVSIPLLEEHRLMANRHLIDRGIPHIPRDPPLHSTMIFCSHQAWALWSAPRPRYQRWQSYAGWEWTLMYLRQTEPFKVQYLNRSKPPTHGSQHCQRPRFVGLKQYSLEFCLTATAKCSIIIFGMGQTPFTLLPFYPVEDQI